jgi:putative membrane protein
VQALGRATAGRPCRRDRDVGREPRYDAAVLNAADACASPVRTPREHLRLPAALLAILLVVCVAGAATAPAGLLSFALEVVPGLLLVAVLAARHRSLPLSWLVYGGVFVHVLILVYGGYYTYARTPLGDWAREAFGFSRNHYDRVGHLAVGVFPALLAREVLLRKTPLRRGGWLTFLSVSVVLAFAAFWELAEWWTVLGVAPDVGQAFLGTQGDVWDAQWDMLLALVGAVLVLPALGRLQDASMAKVPEPRP